MSIFIIATYFTLILIEKPNFYNSIMAAIFIALSISIRILGSILPVVIVFFLLIKFLRNENKNKIKISLLSLLFYYLFLRLFFILIYGKTQFLIFYLFLKNWLILKLIFIIFI